MENYPAPLLEDVSTSEKRLFLSKIGLISAFYFSSTVVASLLILFDPSTTKQIYRTFRLEHSVWGVLVASLLIKTIIAFMGQSYRGFAYFLFILDYCLTFFFTVGLYYVLFELYRVYYISYGHFVIMVSFTCFFNSVIFSVTTILKNKKRIYNSNLGIIFLCFSSLLTLRIIHNIWIKEEVSFVAYMYMLTPFLVINIYVCYNTFLLINYRDDKYQVNDQLFAFYNYFFDIFYVFWIDIYQNLRIYKGRLKTRNPKKVKKLRRNQEKIEQSIEN